MTVPHYGVWVAKPTRYKAEGAAEDPRSPHLTLYFKDDPQGSRERSAAINVKSRDRESRLIVWFVKDFTHPLTSSLADLDLDFYPIPQTSDLEGLDYLRTPNLISDISAGQILPHDVAGPNNDMLDKLVPILKAAIREDATVYIFGSSFASGIHDIHMNQGSLPRFDNGVGQDGGVLFQFPDGHWEAVFLAFASQRIPTNDVTGVPLAPSKSLAKIIEAADE